MTPPRTTLRGAFEAFLSDKLHNSTASFYAIVHNCTPHRPSKGTDFVCNLQLYDESTMDWTGKETIELMMFAKQAYLLPTKAVPHDIIKLKTVKVGEFNCKPQFVGKVNGGCTFRIFPANEDRTDSQEVTGYWRSEEDKARIVELRQLVHQKRQAMEALQLTSAYLRKISELCRGPAELVDIICQVLAVDKRPEQQVVVHVWDGTDAPPMRSDCLFQLTAGGMGPPPPPGPPLFQYALPLSSIPDPDPSLPQRGVQTQLQLPAMGSAVPLLLDLEQFEHSRQALAVGSWVKIKVLATSVVQGQIQLRFSPKSRVNAFGSADERLRSYAQREAGNAINQPGPAAFRSRCECDSDMQPQTVRQLLLSIQRGIPGVFRLNVRLSRYAPLDLAQALVPVAELGLPEEEVSVAAACCGHTYALKVLLEDATGQVDAVLLGKDAELFFQALPPFAPGAKALARKLHDWVSSLVPSATGFSERLDEGCAWLDCCVKLAFLDRVSPGSAWTMPCIRIVQTVAQPPWAS